VVTRRLAQWLIALSAAARLAAADTLRPAAAGIWENLKRKKE